MLYEKLRKHKEPHEAMKWLWNINLKKLAVELDCHYPYLIEILNGKRKAGKRLENDIWRIVEQIKQNN